MADNRLSLRCKECGDEVVIARAVDGWGPARQLGPPYTVPSEETPYAQFLEEHSWCGLYPEGAQFLLVSETMIANDPTHS